VQLFEYYIIYCPFYFIKMSGKGKCGHADTNVKHRSCEVDMTENEIEIIRCAKGGQSLALVGHLLGFVILS
jgi:Zn-finger protein